MGKLFGGRIEPECLYCAFGRPGRDGIMILCQKHGVVAPHYSCWKFSYDPLKRVPKKARRLPQFSPEDFKL
ncbi:hypothetical protein [Zongyangia hominis]|uniref:Uncharacterized protein n=1 Tax=Zongyangia hominis TaxID=2763677 RepID=A0A926EEB1_9FIRM|nr:hypothetical protein [Zongyangia hominis]MBC8570859.1 hypothetical protein [Zongyangia hominis]